MPTDRLVQLLRRRSEPLEMDDVRGLLRMLLLALAHCHDRGVIHRVRILPLLCRWSPLTETYAQQLARHRT